MKLLDQTKRSKLYFNLVLTVSCIDRRRVIKAAAQALSVIRRLIRFFRAKLFTWDGP